MGILLLMLALAGQVMSLTVRATGQANAVVEVNQELRIFEQTIREDMKHVHAGESLILIEGNPINAYWSASRKAADDNADPGDGFPERDEKPRADVLMVFTSRRAVNYVQYDYTGAPPTAEKNVYSGVQQVVYGHANLADLDSTGAVVPGYPEFPADPDTVFSTPAEDWHLARRIVHLLNLPTLPPKATPAWVDALGGSVEESLGGPPILQGETDVITRFDYERWVVEPYKTDPIGQYPYFWPEIFKDTDFPPHARSVLDETPPPRFANRLGQFFIPHCASFKVEWAIDRKSPYVGGLLDDEKEIFWVDPGIEPGPEAPFKQPLGDLYFLATDPSNPDSVQQNKLSKLLTENRGDGGQYNLLDRFGGPPDEFNPIWHDHGFTNGTRPNLQVFTATRLNANNVEDIFPVALRITIELMDKNKRLERPTRHVMIVPVGG